MARLTNSKVSEVAEVQPVPALTLVDTRNDATQVSEVSVSANDAVMDTEASPPADPVTKQVSPIPAIEACPCFRVFDEWVHDVQQKLRPGVWHFGVKGKDDDATRTQDWICSPLHIVAVTTDSHGGNYGRQLRFLTTLGRWRLWTMPMEMLCGDGNDVRGQLLSMGLEIDPKCRYKLATYLQERAPKHQLRCVLQTGWADSTYTAFALPDGVIGPKSGTVAFQSSECEQQEYTQGGTFLGWKEGVAAMAVGNPLLMLALCAAFAGPMLARCNAESGGVHFVGDSSTGKTTAIEAACSVWGGENFRRSWRTTSNGLEGVATLFNDSLLALDEISESDPHDVGAMVYSLGNGRGKQRASRSGAARPVNRWRCSVLSSGERTIGTTMAEGGHRIKAGQSVRLLDVPTQRKHGAWDDLQHHSSGTAFSDALKRAAATHYGHAGRAFLEKLTREHSYDFSQALDDIKALPEFQVDSDQGQTKRAAARFALLALAGELATEFGITGWAEGEARHAAGLMFRSWQALRGSQAGNLERDQVLDQLTTFIERHGNSRFSDVEEVSEIRNAVIRDRAGWWNDTGGRRSYLFTASGMQDAMKGFDLSRALDAMQEAGAIDPPGGDGKRSKFRRIEGRGVRVYIVDPSKLSEGK